MKAPYTIPWHEECLTNMRETLRRERARLVDLTDSVQRLQSDCDTLSAQIAAAKAAGITAFDRFAKPKKRKQSTTAKQ